MTSSLAAPVFAARPNTIINTPQAYDWPMFGHDPAHSATIVGPGPFSNHHLRTNTLNGPIVGSAAAANGTIYVGAGIRIYALNSSTLRAFWTASVGVASTSVAASSGLIYFGTTNGKIIALNAATGTIAWEINAVFPVDSSPIVKGGEVFIAAHNSTLYAINAKSGSVTWKYVTGGNIVSSPASNGVLVAIGSNNGAMNFANEATGSQYWTLGNIGPVSSSASFSGSVAYFGSNDSNVYAVDTATKTRLWHYTTGGPVVATPVLADGLVLVGSLDGKLYALDASTGNPRWTLSTGAIATPGAIAFGTVKGSDPPATPMVYIVTRSGELFGVDVDNGTAVWTLQLSGSNGGAPIIAYTKAYAVSGGGDIYELGALQGATSTRTFTTASVENRVFQSTDTVRLAADTAWGMFGINQILVSVWDPTGTLVLNNATMTFVTGVRQYNIYRDFSLNNAPTGTYKVQVWVEDAHSKAVSSQPRCCGWVFFRASFVVT
jgi:outer membrane protein assembly factor BamB